MILHSVLDQYFIIALFPLDIPTSIFLSFSNTFKLQEFVSSFSDSQIVCPSLVLIRATLYVE